MKPLPILAFLAAAAIGWAVAGNVAKPAKATAAAAAPVREHRAERKARRRSGPDDVARQQMAAIRASRDPAMRMRATVDLARSLSPADFAAWMNGGWFDIRGGAELTLFTKILQQRWEAEDPEGLLANAIATKSGQADDILRKWANTDPQRVLDFFKAHPDDRAEIQALANVAAKDPGMALRRLLEMFAAGISTPGNDMDYSGMLLQVFAKKVPAELEAALDSLKGETKTGAEALVIAGKMKDSFGEEFQKLQDRPDGMKIFSRILNNDYNGDGASKPLREALLQNLATLPALWRASVAEQGYRIFNPENAEQWATADLEGAGFSQEQISRIRAMALSSLSSKPATALKLMAALEMDYSSRQNVIANVFNNLKDADQAAATAKLLTSDKDREYAAGFSRNSQSEDQPKIDTPAAWLSSLANQDPKTGNIDYNYINAARNWDSGQRAELVSQFQALPEETQRAVAEMGARSGYSEAGPLDGELARFLVIHSAAGAAAGDSTKGEDPEIRTIQLASNYVGKIAQSDPTAAGEWIDTLPTGQPKLWAQKNLHSIWSQYDPAAADQWLATQPATDRAALKDLGK